METKVDLISLTAEEPAPGCQKKLGDLKVTTRVTGFRKVRWYTHELLGFGELDLPPSELVTQGFWITLLEDTVRRLEEAGLWTNTENNYGPDWSRIRGEVRARDGYRCQVCGALEIGRSHHVHHKVPFRSFTSREEANRRENLVTLCADCHRKVELNVRIRSGLGGLSYTLGHLAPIFLMCDQADLGIHSDPQSPLGDGRPVVVLYDMVPAGIGLCEHLFELHAEVLAHAGEQVEACGCSDGCPSCVGPGGENGLGGKRETLALINALRDRI
jgi:DEAD/DEAH box helicase domain-containing protein